MRLGATYSSIQIPDVATDVVKQALAEFNQQAPQRLSLYLAEPVGRWTALYPMFSLEADQFAKKLSGVTGGPVVALMSADESDFLCNLCVNGKDLSFFKISADTQRTGKQRDAVIKRVGALEAYATATERAALIETLCDARRVTFSSDLLDAFCRTFAIQNSRSSYEHIAANDYQDDFNQLVPLEHLD
jgi:hypothetical protein